MSYKDGYRADLGTKEPAGSAAPLTSTIDGSKWHHGVDGVGIAKLTKISGEINSIVEETSSTVAKAQIKVGRLLNEARALIPGDLQFGKWREANTSITNKSTANKLMNLAKQVGEGRITQDLIDALPMSTLKELISAPDSVVTYIREQIKEDPTTIPTREVVRDAVREEREPAEITGKEGLPPSVADPAPKVKAPAAPMAAPAPRIDPVTTAEKIIRLPLKRRVAELNPDLKPPFPGCKPIEWAWMLFGMDIDPAILPNMAVVDTLREHYLECCTIEDVVAPEDTGLSVAQMAAMFDRAYTMIIGEYQ